MEEQNLRLPDEVSKEPNSHAMNTVEVCSSLGTCMQNGLAAEQVIARRRTYGWNKLEKEKSRHPVFIFLNQFFDPVIYVLLIAASLAFIFGELLEAVAVLVVILITTLIGFFMEWRATRSMDALRQMAQTTAWVCRDGVELKIRAEEIVPGDILLLKMGDMISADARLLAHQNLMVKEAALTGESTAVSKQESPISVRAPLADRTNMLYKGTIVSKGRGRAVVTATGEYTELGNINRITREVEVTQTPLERNLSRLSRQLIWLTIALSVVIALAGYLQGRDFILMIETAVALAIAAIPEGLPIVATIALARGMQRMAKKNVIIKKLESVQTLGETSVICTDKTGTLTENEMAVHSLALPKRFLIASSHKDSKSLDSDISRLLRSAVLCNDALQKRGALVGDPEEVALVRFAEAYGYDRSDMLVQYPKVWEDPFDTETRSMATGHNIGERFLLCIKGAWESLEPSFDFISDGKEGKRPFKDKAHWNMEVDKLAAQGLRTMAFAERISDRHPEAAQVNHDLTFLGLVGFIDPPRTDVRHAIATCHKAGIKVVMVTGDHPQTARKIAVDTGLITADSEMNQVMVGSHLTQLADLKATKEDQLRDVAVFARVSPAQKLDLIEHYQRQNQTVGMTGDGINDAPALKKADIGIAMGIRGTEAAKEVSDVILKNDQFIAIEMAIRQGRIIFENIRNFVVFLLSCNLAEILSVTMAALSNLPLPLLPLQILYLNLVTDVFPALALGIGEGNKEIMQSPPRNPKESIITKALWQSTVVYGLCITSGVIGISIFAYYHLKLPAAQINNLAFYTLVLGQLLNIFNLPDRTSSFFDNEVTRNPWVWASLVLCLGLTAFGYLTPVLREALSLVPIDLSLMIWVVAFSLGTLLLTQLIKRLGGTV